MYKNSMKIQSESWFSFINVNFSKILSESLFLLGVSIKPAILKMHCTAADEGIAVLYRMNTFFDYVVSIVVEMIYHGTICIRQVGKDLK